MKKEQFIKTFTSASVASCALDAEIWISSHPDIRIITMSVAPPVYMPNRGLTMTGISSPACAVLLCEREKKN